ncbi:hypothetical protein [Flavobacterium aquiphilum]|uniref:hypothetical protein n=1 Tax=Flavobacterium aquiphilum TaxID=3003261 RepID=UPI00247FBD53|nr:hypothetical protein [Flavobacterium aquiphilum]
MKKIIKTIILFFVFFIGAGTYAVNAQNPPAHAKAHGVKKKYRYYPEANVYFDPVVKRYTYFSGGKWTTTINLPTSIRLVGSYNDFDFEGDNPWKDNSMHKEKYKVAKPVNHGDVKHVEKALDIKSNNGNGNGNGKKNKK